MFPLVLLIMLLEFFMDIGLNLCISVFNIIILKILIWLASENRRLLCFVVSYLISFFSTVKFLCHWLEIFLDIFSIWLFNSEFMRKFSCFLSQKVCLRYRKTSKLVWWCLHAAMLLGVFIRELRAISISRSLWIIGSCHKPIGLIWLDFHCISLSCQVRYGNTMVDKSRMPLTHSEFQEKCFYFVLFSLKLN